MKSGNVAKDHRQDGSARIYNIEADGATTQNGSASEMAASVGDGAVEHRGARLVFTVEEAAYLLNISRALAYDLVARGEIPSIRLGRRIAIPRRQLEILLEGPEC
jgi:excisionase family DNA binding protein